jgi:Skp family chaperone for outer membrane proteins
MQTRTLILVLAAFTAPLWAVSAPAQTQPAAEPAQPLGGPSIEGVCLLSRQALLVNAKVGQAATERLQVLAREAQAQVDAERAALEADVQKFQAEQAKLPADERTQRQKALEDRGQAVRDKATQLSREIESTRMKALERIANEAQPVIAQVYGHKKCGLLIDRNSVLGGNMSNDLTPMIVQGLDAKITTITFDLEVLPPLAASAQPVR